MSTPAPSIEAQLSARLSRLESEAAADTHSISTWFKTNWAHLVTWIGVAYPILKHLV